MPATDPAAAAPLDRVAVLGAGGLDLALALLATGREVLLLEEDAHDLARLDAGLTRRLDPAQRARLTLTTDAAPLRAAPLVLIATPLSAAARAALSPGAILALLDAQPAGDHLPDPARVIGLHASGPGGALGLVELTPLPTSSPAALATGEALARALGLVTVTAGRGGSAIGPRLTARYHEAADTVFMDGSTPWEVDEAMVAFGFPFGPYEAQDLTGLDHAHRLPRRQEPGRRRIPLADRMLELGKLGQKTGAGWYRYPGGGGKVEDPIVADLAIEESHFAGRIRTDYTPEEIQERLLLALINEAAALLDEGVARAAADIDLVMRHGLGFPAARGGLMTYADTLGAAHILARLHSLAAEDPIAWAPAARLVRAARSGTPLSQG